MQQRSFVLIFISSACEQASKWSGAKKKIGDQSEPSVAWGRKKADPQTTLGSFRSTIFFFTPLHLGTGSQASLLLIVSFGLARQPTKKHSKVLVNIRTMQD